MNRTKYTPQLGATILSLILAFAAYGQTTNEQLPLNRPLERQIKGGETHIFQFNTKAGSYARAEIEQKNIDVTVSLFAADDNLVVEMDGKDGNLWREAVSCISEKSGWYQVVIKAYGAVDQAGSYTVRLAENRSFAPNDRKRLEAEKHLSAGRRFYSQAEFSEAGKEYATAAELWREIANPEWEAISLLNLGWTYNSLLNSTRATEALNRALSLFQVTKDRAGEGKAANGLGNSYLNVSQAETARKFFEQALVIRREIRDRRGEGSTLNNLGILHNGLGQYEKARDYYEQSLIVTREVKNRLVEGLTLNNLGNVYESLAQYTKARDCYEQALSIVRELKYRLGEGGLLNNLGNIYYRETQYEKARDYFEQALVITKEVKERSSENAALTGLATVYNRLGQYNKARDYFEQALLIAREIKDRPSEVLALTGLGNIYRNLTQYEKARESFEQALQIAQEINDPFGKSLILIHLGNLYNDLAQFERAKDYFEQALIVTRNIKDRNSESDALISLGLAYSDSNQNEKAKNYYEEALLIKREIKDRSGEAATCWNLTLLWQKLNKPRLAIIYGKQAVNIYQEIRRNITGFDKETQNSFLADNIKVYRLLSDILIAEGRILEAEQVLNLLKAEEFGAVLRRGGVEEKLLPYSTAEEAAIQIIDRLATLGGQRADLLALKAKGAFPAAGDARLTEIDAQIATANAEFRRSLENLAKETKFDGKEFQEKADSMRNVLRDLDKGTVALYTLVVCGNDSPLAAAGRKTDAKQCESVRTGWIILVTPDFRKAYPMDVRELNETVATLRQALSSDRYDPAPVAKKLYDKLFRQTSAKQKTTLEADLNEYFTCVKPEHKTLMWSLDGVLRYIPTAVLHDGEGYLIKKYRNFIFTTASLTRLKDPSQPAWKVLGLGVSEARDGFPALPGVRRELMAIVRDGRLNNPGGIIPGTIRLNNEFTRQAFLAGLREGYPVVHLASHFSYKNRQENSFLLLGDGHLTLGEMRDFPPIFADVDLLTLSACNTATSDADNGKEVEGLGIVAQSLGAKAVIASLWEVADTGTDALMTNFYQLRADNPNLPKGEALRQAQLALLRDDGKPLDAATTTRAEPVGAGNPNALNLPLFKPDDKKPFAHPHYWSSFVLIGNWR